ncbi:MAG: T9SS type A sorting domain-containing protein [Ignavibacteriaceae bacterium]
MKTLILLLAISIPALAQIPFPQDTIAYNNRFNNREFGQYNSQGLIRLSYTSGLGTVSSYNEIYYVEEVAGGNFTTVNLTNNTVDDNYSTLSIDQNDRVHICYESRDPSIFQVMYMNNISGSFSSPISITQGGLNKATPFGKIGPDSVMHFVYYTYTNGSDNCYYRNYDLKTSTLGPEVFLSNGEASGDFQATLDIDSNGKVHIALVSGTTLTSGPLKYFNNVTGTFQQVATSVSVNVSYPRIRVDANNKIHIIYRANSMLYYIDNVSGTFSSPVAITPAGQLPAGIQSLEIDNENRMYTTYQSSQSASGKGFYLLFAENGVFNDTILIADLPPEYVTRNSSQVITKGNGDIAMFYAEGDVRNDTVICDIFMKRGNIYNIIPVELISFSAEILNSSVRLIWKTATETNNYGFEVYRFNKNSSNEWKRVGFVKGNGTANENNNYTFDDVNLDPGIYKYKLKQIDFDGSFKYSGEVEAEVKPILEFTLYQNYPNPFNPATTINYSTPVAGKVLLVVYNLLGEKVTTLVDEVIEAGNHQVKFDGVELNSGIYFYTLTAGSFRQSKKMFLLK